MRTFDYFRWVPRRLLVFVKLAKIFLLKSMQDESTHYKSCCWSMFKFCFFSAFLPSCYSTWKSWKILLSVNLVSGVIQEPEELQSAELRD